MLSTIILFIFYFSKNNSDLSDKQNKEWHSITAPALGASNITIPSTANELIFSIYDDADKFVLTIPTVKIALPSGWGANFGNGGYADASLSSWGQVYTDGNICRIASAYLNGNNIISRCQLTLFYR